MSQVFDRRDGQLIGRFVRRDEGRVVYRAPDTGDRHIGSGDAIVLTDKVAAQVAGLELSSEVLSEEDYNAGRGGWGAYGLMLGHDDLGRVVMLCDPACRQDDDGNELYLGWRVLAGCVPLDGAE